jgi:hypothetical protein
MSGTRKVFTGWPAAQVVFPLRMAMVCKPHMAGRCGCKQRPKRREIGKGCLECRGALLRVDVLEHLKGGGESLHLAPNTADPWFGVHGSAMLGPRIRANTIGSFSVLRSGHATLNKGSHEPVQDRKAAASPWMSPASC